MKKETTTVSNKSQKRTVNRVRLEDIPVKVHIPDRVNESIRQQKINRIYDILTAHKAS